VREGPSADATVVTQLKNGDTLTVTEDPGDNWIKVEAEGQTGYVHRDYISIDGAGE
jgi:N-acetylmuramoyl-L-alanine amidase